MNLGLEKKVAIVLGASRGLGKATAAALANEGVSVVIVARDEKPLQRTVKEIQKLCESKILGIEADVTNPEDLQSMVTKTLKEFGKIDILVNNAGGPPAGTFELFGDTQWQTAFETNFMSAVRMIRLVLPSMKKQKKGRIINMVSISVKQPVDNLILSNAIRPGVVGMAKTLATELAPFNITVNNICPGHFLTDRIRHLFRIDEKVQRGMNETEALQEAAKEIPMKRLGKPEEFGALVAFLASNQAAYITGTTIQIDGGLNKSLL